MYQWIVFLHVLGGFGFMLGHGASVAAMFRVRHERNVEKLKAILDLSLNLTGFTYISLLVMLISGVALGFVGRWWGQGWLWISLGLLIAMTILMAVFGGYYFNKLRWALGLPVPRSKEDPPEEVASAKEIEQIIQAGRPILVTAIGVVGWGLILWLMMFKPF
ncbi:MAG: DUF2269 family protein [Anaerolineales bacterium]